MNKNKISLFKNKDGYSVELLNSYLSSRKEKPSWSDRREINAVLSKVGYGKHNKNEDFLVHTSNNYFLNKYKKTFKVGGFTAPSSVDKNRYIGVEIECLVDLSTMNIDPTGSAERDCYTCEGTGTLTYTHRDSGYELEGECQHCEGSGTIEDEEGRNDETVFEEVEEWVNEYCMKNKIKGLNVKLDGSVSDDGGNSFGVEFTLIYNNPEMLQKVCQLLKTLNAEVNDSCGLHVHLDCRDKSKEQVIEIGEKFSKNMEFLAAMVPEKRRSNTYCALGVSGLSGDRYKAVNLTAFEKYKTIEVRLHSGTVDFQKINNWVTILSNIKSSEMTEDVSDWEGFYAMINADRPLINYIDSRVSKFKQQKVA